MEKLIEILKEFEKNFNEITDETKLQKVFRDLAPAFLYGGYIQVRQDYKVYIRTVEFYFHSEKNNGIHDPIVYHRNGRDLEKVPYFPLMSLHAHNSGLDITFESEKKEYRASALIRSYEVVDKNGCYLEWRKNEKGKYMFLKNSDYKYNTQSTYLYALLNGFAFGNENDIRWIDSPRTQLQGITEKTRQNVFQYKNEKGEYIKTDRRCERKWSFTREERV